MTKGENYGTTFTKLWGLLSDPLFLANLHIQNPGAITKSLPKKVFD